MSEKINKNFKGLYDTSKTTFITDRTEPTRFYEPEVKTPRIKNVSYSINFDKKELYKQIDDLQQKVEQLENIRKEAIEYVLKNKLYGFKYDDEELFEITTDKKAKDDLLNILNKGDNNGK